MGCEATKNSNIQPFTDKTVLSLNKIYERMELIGSGTYGKVYRCINKLDNNEYALKVVQITAKTKQEATKQIGNLKSQISVLRRLNHPNIIKYYSFDISPDNQNVEIVLEYARNGSLKDYIAQNGPFNSADASKKCKQILDGLRYLHSQSVVHRDLKCANILVASDGTLKISDFGTAKHIKISSNQDIAKLCLSLKGTPYYMAPQVLKRSGHGSSADIWSLGCTLIEMLTGKAPWTSLTNNFEQIISYILSGIHPPYPSGLPQECQCFLESCMDPMPSQRLTAEQLLKHRYIDQMPYVRSRKSSMLSYQPLSKQNQTVKTKPSRNEYYVDEDDIELEQKSLEEIEIVNKTKQKINKRQEINEYIQNRTQKKKKTGEKSTVVKGKKERISSFNITQSKVGSNENQDIQVIPHLQYSQVTKNLFDKYPKSAKSSQSKGLKVTKTAPDVKIPQKVLQDLRQIEQNTLEVQRIDLRKKQNRNLDVYRSRTDMECKPDAINTVISREERDRYLEGQKLAQQQRDEQRKKWERELKEGGDYLRKQISTRYRL